jgi:hypothetical protein
MARIGYNPEILPIHEEDLVPRAHPSDCVESLDYDVETQELTINFWERGSYKYFGFENWAFNEFNNAGSRGTYFNLYIRNAGYAYERIA